MKVKILLENGEKHELCDVQTIYNIKQCFTQHEELKDTLLVIHRADHIEKFRLYKNARVLQIQD